MPTVQHAALTGAELHEPKGIAAAGADEIYVADGASGGAHESFNNVVGINCGNLTITTTGGTGGDGVSTTIGLPWDGRICALSWQMTEGDVLNTTQEVTISQDAKLIVSSDSTFSGSATPEHVIFNSADAAWTVTPTNCDYLNSNTVQFSLNIYSVSAAIRTFTVENLMVYIDIGKKVPYTEVA